MQNTDESELIAQSLHGNTEAYGKLVDRYKNAIYHHCFAMIRDEDAAQDMAQETFIAAYYQLKKYNAQYRFSTWLFKISTNRCLNHIRSSAKTITLNDDFDALPTNEPSPHHHAEMHELHELVDHLQPKYRAVISLYYWQGLEYADIATAMDAPINSIRVWLLRAKNELRKELS
ncbi:MAG TPA: sigma-70 family RNA polymerase sigma factor [Candidatus Saccharimonadia bacterium]|nr:sigma-70 family RNA polymerase sigma factor [Candidatus Saccharimonadia bacterium]